MLEDGQKVQPFAVNYDICIIVLVQRLQRHYSMRTLRSISEVSM